MTLLSSTLLILDLNLNMDWTDFQILYWFFKKANIVLYLGNIDLLNFTLQNANQVYFVSPEKVELEKHNLKKFEENPESIDLSLLPKRVDRIINLLPMNIVTSFKMMGRFFDLLEKNARFLVQLEIPKKQDRYSNLIFQDLLPRLNSSQVAYLEIEDTNYLIGKKL